MALMDLQYHGCDVLLVSADDLDDTKRARIHLPVAVAVAGDNLLPAFLALSLAATELYVQR